MAEHSKIEWTDHTFNPWVGCTKVGPGCDHCYAEGWAKRAGKAAGVEWGGDRRRTSEATWRQPLKWNAQAQAEGRRYRVFCASLADVFDNQVPTAWRVDLLRLIEQTPHLDWLLLTKRIGNVESMLDEAGSLMPEVLRWPLSNVWLGATVVNQAEADRDIPKLLQVPARVRFLSIEPMLGPIELPREALELARGFRGERKAWPDGNGIIDWVIVGGESGPMHPDWARSLRDQCAAAGVPFLFKQWGEWLAEADGADMLGTERSPLYQIPTGGLMVKVGKKAAGRVLDGVTHDGFPA